LTISLSTIKTFKNLKIILLGRDSYAFIDVIG